MVQPPSDLRNFASLVEIIKALRGPEGCPWDKEQTHRTLTPFAIEEAHELAEAIEREDWREMVLELGDLLLQVVLHSEIGRQEKRFDIHDVIGGISEKMVRRHPHVFSNTSVANSKDVLDSWSKLKAEEKVAKEKTGADPNVPSHFDIPTSLPALARAQKIGDKTKNDQFDWSELKEVMVKVREEVRELDEVLAEPKLDKTRLEHEIGDVLFSAAQLARHAGLEAEQCLRTANNRFEKRFFAMKDQVNSSGRNWTELKPEEREAAWRKVKLAEGK
jgi:tetrapyrrole methylase family protein/MazG family protein